MDRRFYVYMLASKVNGTLYVGVTNDLSRRIAEHREKTAVGFTSKYGVTRLVWFESFDRVDDAIQHEKRLKRWRRDWKIQLIEKANPAWRDLYEELLL